ncbi:MAG: hypothetical protein BWK75_04800 [Candidatus Altiarchaeales archaeon A3]|nr:MAG: hypothetical protein BWK75_04800 [Candidatus Altiarchaeales archaeon A3]
MKYKSYFKYKDSGVQWIGEIPEGWNTNKIKHNVLPLESPDLKHQKEMRKAFTPFLRQAKFKVNLLIKQFLITSV